MNRIAVLSHYQEAGAFSRQAVELAVQADASYASGMLNAHDFVLMAVGAAGVAVKAANEAVDARALPGVAKRAVELAGEAVERLQWLFAGRDHDSKLDDMRVRVAGLAGLVELAFQQLEADGGAVKPREVH